MSEICHFLIELQLFRRWQRCAHQVPQVRCRRRDRERSPRISPVQSNASQALQDTGNASSVFEGAEDVKAFAVVLIGNGLLAQFTSDAAQISERSRLAPPVAGAAECGQGTLV